MARPVFLKLPSSQPHSVSSFQDTREASLIQSFNIIYIKANMGNLSQLGESALRLEDGPSQGLPNLVKSPNHSVQMLAPFGQSRIVKIKLPYHSPIIN